jgi:hypothetical protein
LKDLVNKVGSITAYYKETVQCQDLMYGHKVRIVSTTTLENQNQTGGFALTASPSYCVVDVIEKMRVASAVLRCFGDPLFPHNYNWKVP